MTTNSPNDKAKASQSRNNVAPLDEQTELRIKLESLAVTAYVHGQNGTAYEPEKDIKHILGVIESREAEAYRRGQVEEVKILQKAMYPHKGALNILGNELKLLSQQPKQEEK